MLALQEKLSLSLKQRYFTFVMHSECFFFFLFGVKTQNTSNFKIYFNNIFMLGPNRLQNIWTVLSLKDWNLPDSVEAGLWGVSC